MKFRKIGYNQLNTFKLFVKPYRIVYLVLRMTYFLYVSVVYALLKITARSNINIPSLDDVCNLSQETVPFMAYSTCSAIDFFHPNYREICQHIAERPQFHRKQWEYVYIIHCLRTSGILSQNARGLGFGVGTEPLSSFFAAMGCHLMATDAPPNIANIADWNLSNQFSGTLEKVHHPNILSKNLFDERVQYQTCNMNDIDPTLTEFDFCWSSCCFEHLGSLQAGIDFVINSVEKTLRIGGVACHTTEYNLSSNDHTIEDGPTVIYRRQDIERLINVLRERGHLVSELRIHSIRM